MLKKVHSLKIKINVRHIGESLVLTLWLFLPLHLQNNNTGFTSKRLLKHRMHMLFYNILTIPKLQHSDQGLYTCRVTSGENTKQQKVSVTVYGECLPFKLFNILDFINHKHMDIWLIYMSIFSFYVLFVLHQLMFFWGESLLRVVDKCHNSFKKSCFLNLTELYTCPQFQIVHLFV